jgi:hypothetical protein
MAGKKANTPADPEAEARFEKAIRRALSIPASQVPTPKKRASARPGQSSPKKVKK